MIFVNTSVTDSHYSPRIEQLVNKLVEDMAGEYNSLLYLIIRVSSKLRWFFTSIFL